MTLVSGLEQICFDLELVSIYTVGHKRVHSHFYTNFAKYVDHFQSNSFAVAFGSELELNLPCHHKSDAHIIVDSLCKVGL